MLEPLEQELRLDLELRLEFLEPMLELLDCLVLMLELLDRLEFPLMESRPSLCNADERTPDGTSISPCLIA